MSSKIIDESTAGTINKQHTPEQSEAIEVADANLNNVCLPLYSEVIVQRDELLAALREIVRHYEYKGDLDSTPAKRAEAWRQDYHHLKQIAGAAIAKATGAACHPE